MSALARWYHIVGYNVVGYDKVKTQLTTQLEKEGISIVYNENIDQIPEDFGTGPGVMKSGLADMTLENRKDLKETVTKLANIILKKEKSKKENVEEAHENQEDFKKTASTAS